MRGGRGEVASLLNIALQFPTFFNSIVHLHHNLLAKAAYRAENNRNPVELLVSDKADLITFVSLGIGSFQTNPAGLTGSLGTAGTASLGNPFGTTTGLGSTSLTSGCTFGIPLRTNTLGFGTPALGSSTGGAFGSTGTGLGGTGLAPGLQRLLYNQSFSFKGHRLVTSEAKGDETSRMYVVLSKQLKLLVLNIIYSIYKGSLDGFHLIPNKLHCSIASKLYVHTQVKITRQ